jgi:hypothetical protein
VHPALQGGRRGNDGGAGCGKGPLRRDGADVRRGCNHGCLWQSGRTSSGTPEVGRWSDDGSPVRGQVQAGASGSGKGHGRGGTAACAEIRNAGTTVQLDVWSSGISLARPVFAGNREGTSTGLGLLGWARLAAFGRRCGASGRIVGDVGGAIVAMLLEWRLFQNAAGRRGPNDEDGDQVPEHRLHEGAPGLAGFDKHVVPEESGAGGGQNRRRRLARQSVGKVAQENAIAGFEFVEQLQAGIGLGGNRCVRNQEPRAFVHGFTPEGGKTFAHYSRAPGKGNYTVGQERVGWEGGTGKN